MKVISFSLWGDNPIYTEGAIRNADLAQELYPDWVCWYFVGQSVPKETVAELKRRNNTQVISMEEEGDWSGMFWRFYPASDPRVEVMVSRDTDSRLSRREKEAVNEWLRSGKSFHIMRDHPYHGTPILGGMWGVKFPKLKDLTKWIDSYTKGEFWQVDQNFLKEVVYDEVREDCIVHDEFFENRPFPSKREGKEFVGMAYDQDDMPLHPEHMEMVKV
jgi:protein O-GlcNAc transferase